MKVYGVCVQCSDDYYGYNPPRKMFSTKEKAEQYMEENFEYDDEEGVYYEGQLLFMSRVEIIEWEVE